MAELSPGVGLNLSLHLGLLRFFLEFAMGLSLGKLATENRLPATLPLLAGGALVAGLLVRQDALAVAGLAALIATIWQRGAVSARSEKPDLSLRRRPEIGAPSERTSARQLAYVSSSRWRAYSWALPKLEFGPSRGVAGQLDQGVESGGRHCLGVRCEP
jgi:hypothetical protein